MDQELMGELLILALGRALYTRKHCLDKAVNVGSIPTSPTRLFWIDRQQVYPKLFDKQRCLSYNRYLGQLNVL